MRYSAYFYAMFSVIAWGGTFIAVKLSMDVMSSLTLLFVRYLLSVAILAVFYRKRPRRKIEKEDYKYFVFIGVMGYFLSQAVQMVATAMIDASMSSLINTMTPVGILIFAIIILKERVNRRQKIGIFVTISGALVIIGAAGGANGPVGMSLAFGGMLLWALTSVYIRKICQKYDPVWVTIYTTAIALLCSIPFAIGEISVVGIHPEALDMKSILAILWISAISTAAANIWWSRALERLPATTCSLFYPLMTLTTSALGILLLGEVLTVNFLIGSVLITCGLLYTILGEIRGEAVRKKSLQGEGIDV